MWLPALRQACISRKSASPVLFTVLSFVVVLTLIVAVVDSKDWSIIVLLLTRDWSPAEKQVEADKQAGQYDLGLA